MTKLTEKVTKIEKLVKEGYKVKFYYDLFPMLISPEGELENIFWKENSLGPSIYGFIGWFYFTKIREWSYWIVGFGLSVATKIYSGEGGWDLTFLSFLAFNGLAAYAYPYFLYESKRRGVKVLSNWRAAILTIAIIIVSYIVLQQV